MERLWNDFYFPVNSFQKRVWCVVAVGLGLLMMVGLGALLQRFQQPTYSKEGPEPVETITPSAQVLVSNLTELTPFPLEGIIDDEILDELDNKVRDENSRHQHYSETNSSRLIVFLSNSDENINNVEAFYDEESKELPLTFPEKNINLPLPVFTDISIEVTDTFPANESIETTIILVNNITDKGKLDKLNVPLSKLNGTNNSRGLSKFMRPMIINRSRTFGMDEINKQDNPNFGVRLSIPQFVTKGTKANTLRDKIFENEFSGKHFPVKSGNYFIVPDITTNAPFGEFNLTRGSPMPSRQPPPKLIRDQFAQKTSLPKATAVEHVRILDTRMNNGQNATEQDMRDKSANTPMLREVESWKNLTMKETIFIEETMSKLVSHYQNNFVQRTLSHDIMCIFLQYGRMQQDIIANGFLCLMYHYYHGSQDPQIAAVIAPDLSHDADEGQALLVGEGDVHLPPLTGLEFLFAADDPEVRSNIY